jgi:hypothetical protein
MCVKAGIGRGFVPLTVPLGRSPYEALQQVVFEGPCACGSTRNLQIKLHQVRLLFGCFVVLEGGLG